MATGWAPEGAVQDQIDDSIADSISHARAKLPTGEAREFCIECGDRIPEARRKAMPGARACVPCQSARDDIAPPAGYNRRGSKDSQLR